MMRWSPWAGAASEGKRRKYRVKMDVRRIDGLFTAAAPSVPTGDGDAPRVVWVEIRWKGPPRSRGLSSLKGRRKPTRSASVDMVVRAGTAEWKDGDGATFDHVCGFSETEREETLSDWDVSIHLCVNDKLEEIGMARLNLRDMVSKLRAEAANGSSDRSQTLRELPVAISSVEIISVRDIPETSLSLSSSSSAVAAARDESTAEKSYTLDSEASGEIQMPAQSPSTTAGAGEQTGSTSSEGRSSEKQSEPPPRRGLLSWRKKRRKTSDGGEGKGGGIGASQFPITCSSGCSSNSILRVRSWQKFIHPRTFLPQGWEEKELISREGKTKLSTGTFFASIDQRDDSAGGESACAVLAVVIADKLQSNQMNPPTQAQFDALIREGSSEWRKLCEAEPYASRFSDKHFDLETVMEANLRPVAVSPENSFVGFFLPESFESLRGAMSFDDIWSEIAAAAEEGGAAAAKVYIVSWNDHFFLLKAEAEAFYVIDTLGERLSEGCDKAYVLKFDEGSFMRGLPEKEGDEGELICSGKSCCREFINRFLVAIPLREELEAEEKRRDGPPASTSSLHQRLQIEFHRVKPSEKTGAMNSSIS
ncbi:unnamed protein product [Spirodela intermedia]|uniref:Uncharacterized protein n=1 Tax=Spirodela intermedia TaxID=51605 RepID=A0A7I8KYY6_SPIIN|nr:unnamed protein product [Spirodela intermedia]